MNINMRQKDLRPAPALIEFKGMKFLITDRPSDITINHYITELKKNNVNTVVRVCEPSYNTEELEAQGIVVKDLAFEDGTFPPQYVVDEWFEILKQNFIKSTTSESNCSTLVSFMRNQRFSLKHLPHRNADNNYSLDSSAGTNIKPGGINSCAVKTILTPRIHTQKQTKTTSTTASTTTSTTTTSTTNSTTPIKVTAKKNGIISYNDNTTTTTTTTTCPTIIFSSKTIDSVQKFTKNNSKLTLQKVKNTTEEVTTRNKVDERRTSRYQQNPEACVAVHCVAGLGRAPVLVALALIELGLKYEAAVEMIRDKRRGAINAKQLSYLERYKPKARLKHKNGHKNSCCIQ